MKRASLLPLSLLVVACAHAPAPAPGPASAPAPAPTPASASASASRLHVRISAPPGYTPRSGRVIVAMSNDAASKDPREPQGFAQAVNDTWWAAAHVLRFAPSEPLEIDPDLLASPKPFSQAPSGSWKIAATFHPDGAKDDAEDIGSEVVTRAFDPAHAGVVELAFAGAKGAPPPVTESETMKIVRAPSARLSAFFGRPVTIDAVVLLPDSYAKDDKRTYGTIYSLPGFGGTLERLARWSGGMRKQNAARKEPEAITVLVPGMVGTGHHGFVDSVNDGPWLTAFVDDLIPAIEKQFRVVKKPEARLLGGHSSGGWASLWVMLHRPEAFAATWSTSPDPVDLRDYIGVDVTPGSTDNFYRKADGTPHEFLRMGGKDTTTIERFWRWEEVMGGVGAMGTFEWEWSPRGGDGLPLPLFDRATGALHQDTLKAWEAYDIRKLVDARWPTLGPKVKGKLHIFCGSVDNFHLEGAVMKLCDALKAKGSDAVCEIVPGRDHMDLFGGKEPNDFALRIAKEHGEALMKAGLKITP